MDQEKLDVSTNRDMFNEQYSFEGKPFDKKDLQTVIVFLIFIIYWIVQLINKQNYWGSSIMVLLGLLILYTILFRNPKPIYLTKEGILLDKDIIMWSDIESVLFTVPDGRLSRDIKIIIYGKQKYTMYAIRPMLYEHSKELRLLVENICLEKDIKYVIRDRARMTQLFQPNNRINPINKLIPMLSLFALPIIVLILLFIIGELIKLVF